jgi:hypothetical protein
MSQSAIEVFLECLSGLGVEGKVFGSCRDREFWLEFSAKNRRYQLCFEFPLLPCLLVFRDSSDIRIDQECLNPKLIPSLSDIESVYYSTVERIPDRDLESYRCTSLLDKWVVPVVQEYSKILRSRLKSIEND